MFLRGPPVEYCGGLEYFLKINIFGRIGPRPIGPRKFPFKPTTSAWRQYHSKRLQIVSERMPCTVRRQIKSELKEPTKIRKIDGDGNCLFRALSAEITNSQDHHTLIKHALVTFMTSEDTSHIFSNYCGQDIKVYVANSQMVRLGIWATDVEISAAATFLQTDVFVHTQVNPTMSK